jgi:hypothetical protein
MKSIKELVYEKLEQANVGVGDFYIRPTNGFSTEYIDIIEVLAISEREIAKIERTRVDINSNEITHKFEHVDVDVLNDELTDGRYAKVESEKSALTAVMQSIDNKSKSASNIKKLKKICRACF